MENQIASPRRFEVTKLEERVAPSTLHIGGITIDYTLSGNSVSGTISLPGGQSYSGTVSLSQILSYLHH